MAQQNTGLGWSAEEDWLVQNDITLATLAEISGGTLIPYSISSGAEVDSIGLELYRNQEGFYKSKIVTTTPGATAIVMSYINSGGYYVYLGISSTRNCQVEHWEFNYNTGVAQKSSTAILSYQFKPGLYAYTIVIDYSTNVMVHNSAIPSYASESDCFNNAESVNYTFSKSNPGYAVAALAKWKTSAGAAITTPVLISSDSEFTDMETDMPGVNIAKLNILLSGVRFYMSFFDVVGKVYQTALQSFDKTGEGDQPLTLEQVCMSIISASYAHVIIINSPDPYEEAGAGSEEEGGAGEETSDDDAGIEAGSDFPSAINTGFCRIFSPSESELRNLSNYLWSNSYDLAQVKKLFSNPMDSILGLSAVPIRLLGSSVSFSLGGVPITGMTLPLVSQQRYTYHMGTVTINERWGSYLDYDPYTKFSIFLPFIGMRELAADDIMGKTVALVYDIDILTGMCVARLQAGTNCLYEWGGNCAIQLPINSRNWDSVFSTAVSAVGGIVSAVTGGSAPLVAGSVASAALQTVSMKPRIDKSSTIGGAAGWLGQMTPYIIRTTPEAFIPTDQNKFIGYPAYINVALDSISGYNEVESIHLENVTATGAELEEIESILKGGVIF